MGKLAIRGRAIKKRGQEAKRMPKKNMSHGTHREKRKPNSKLIRNGSYKRN